MPNLAIWDEVVGTDEAAGVDAALRHKLVNVDRAGRFHGDVFKLVLPHFDIGVGLDLVPFRDVIVGNILARVGIHLGIFDAVARPTVDLIEANLLGIGRGRTQSGRAGHKRKAQKAFPVNSAITCWARNGAPSLPSLPNYRLAEWCWPSKPERGTEFLGAEKAKV